MALDSGWGYTGATLTDPTGAIEASDWGVATVTLTDPAAPGVGPIAALRARLANAANVPVPLAFAGSSTTQGTGASSAANRYVNRVVTALQAAHPNGAAESAVQAQSEANFTTISTTPGIHGYNLGQGGATASNFFTSDERTKVAALNPAAVFVMIFSNDYAFNTTPASAKASLSTVLADLKTKAPNAIQILIHSYERMDVTGTYDWDLYRDALQELQAASPTDRIFLNVAPNFESRGVPGADPDNLIGSDNIHATDVGYDYLSSLIVAAIDGPTDSTSSGWGFASATMREPHLPIGVFDGTTVRYVPMLTWDGTEVR